MGVPNVPEVSGTGIQAAPSLTEDFGKVITKANTPGMLWCCGMVWRAPHRAYPCIYHSVRGNDEYLEGSNRDSIVDFVKENR